MTADGTQRHDAGLLRGAGIALGLVAALAAALTMAAPLVSGDLFWHLSAGRWMLENGALPRTDPFSHTAGDARWVLQEYGSQVLFALAERVAGLDGLRVLGGTLAALLTLLVWRTARRPLDGTTRLPLALAGGLTALFVALYAYKWELRPQLLSAFLFFGLVRLLFERTDDQRAAPTLRQSLLAGALCCLWVQLHAEALFGPILATVGLSGAVAAALFVRGASASQRLRRIGAWLVALASVFIGTLLSPLGLEPHRYALADRSVAQDFIEEWQFMFASGERAFPLTVEYRVFVWIVALGVLVVLLRQGLALVRGGERAEHGAGTAREAGRVHWERYAFACLCLLMAFTARRYFWLLWFPLLDAARELARDRAVLTSTGLASTGIARTARRGLAQTVALVAGGLALVASSTSLIVDGARRALAEGRYGDTVDAAFFPVHATRAVHEAGFSANLFHPYSWGGYLGWVLGPDNPVFVDGRTVLFQDVIPIRHRAEREPEYARQVLDQYGVDAIVYSRLVDHGEGPFFWRPPDGDRRWIRAWVDRASVVWLRRERTDALDALTDWYEGVGVDFDRQHGANAFAPLEANPDWLDARELLSPELTEGVRPHVDDLAATGSVGARAWLEVGDLAWRSGMEREAAHAFVRAGDLLLGPFDAGARRAWRARYTELGPERAFDELRRQVPRAGTRVEGTQVEGARVEGTREAGANGRDRERRP